MGEGKAYTKDWWTAEGGEGEGKREGKTGEAREEGMEGRKAGKDKKNTQQHQ